LPSTSTSPVGHTLDGGGSPRHDPFGCGIWPVGQQIVWLPGPHDGPVSTQTPPAAGVDPGGQQPPGTCCAGVQIIWPVSGLQYCVVPGPQPFDGGGGPHDPFGCGVWPGGHAQPFGPKTSPWRQVGDGACCPPGVVGVCGFAFSSWTFGARTHLPSISTSPVGHTLDGGGGGSPGHDPFGSNVAPIGQHW
jgi:hypothetical protein